MVRRAVERLRSMKEEAGDGMNRSGVCGVGEWSRTRHRLGCNGPYGPGLDGSKSL